MKPTKQARGFVMPTRQQLAYPLAARGQAGDVHCVTPLEKIVLFALASDMWRYKGRSRMSNMEIGLAAGMLGNGNKIARKIMNVITGRRSHDRRLPGLEGKGFITIIRQIDPRTGPVREIEYTRKWIEAQRFTVGAESEEPTTAPAAARIAPQPITPPTAATDPIAPAEPPTADQQAELFGPLSRVGTRPDLARKLIDKLRDRGIVLELQDGRIRPRRVSPHVELPGAAEVAALKWLRVEVIAELLAQVIPTPAEVAEARTAPRVANPDAIRAMIGHLTAAPPGDDTCCEALADGLVAAFSDPDPERSRSTYLGIARAINHLELAPAVVIEAFEEACKPRKVNRGAAFIAEIKRLKANGLKS